MCVFLFVSREVVQARGSRARIQPGASERKITCSNPDKNFLRVPQAKGSASDFFDFIACLVRGAAQIQGVDLTVRLLQEQLLAVAAGFLLFLSRGIGKDRLGRSVNVDR
jgi:hypothetical protein